MATVIRKQSTDMETFYVSIPKVDMKRFRGIIRAMGWKIEEKNAIETSLDEVKKGNVIKYNTLEDLIKDI